MIFDWDAWDAARSRKTTPQPATQTLDALWEQLGWEHTEGRHGGNAVRWGLDLAGSYCVDCLDVGYQFNLYPLDGFIRVFDGYDPETDFYEVSFLTEDEV